MKELILKALHALSPDDYLLTAEHTESAELFFVKQKLDMRRMKDVTNYTVTVYRDFTDGDRAMRGHSAVTLCPGMSEAEVSAAVTAAYEAASHVKNPAYPLPVGGREAHMAVPSAFRGHTLGECAEELTQALFAADIRSDAFLNSAELFITHSDVHTMTSTGTDVSYDRIQARGEFVVQALEPQDVEQYFSFAYADLTPGLLTEKVAAALNTVCDRAHATSSLTAGDYDILLTGENLRTVLDFYLSRSAGSMVYAGYSDWQCGRAVQGETVTGERLNMTLLPDAPYSPEGIPMQERTLLADGVLRTITADARFAHYLGVEPTGSYHRIRLSDGTTPFSDMKRPGTLWCVSFSDFQMDEFTGHFGGEIRLAYLFTEDGVRLITGGSVNGNLLDKQSDLTFSIERYTDLTYEGPLALRMHAVPVAG